MEMLHYTTRRSPKINSMIVQRYYMVTCLGDFLNSFERRKKKKKHENAVNTKISKLTFRMYAYEGSLSEVFPVCNHCGVDECVSGKTVSRGKNKRTARVANRIGKSTRTVQRRC